MFCNNLHIARRKLDTHTHDTQHATHNTQHRTHNTQHTTHNTQHTTHNARHRPRHRQRQRLRLAQGHAFVLRMALLRGRARDRQVSVRTGRRGRASQPLSSDMWRTRASFTASAVRKMRQDQGHAGADPVWPVPDVPHLGSQCGYLGDERAPARHVR
jgi:hypothetical protein